jgi:hypothetical protein
MLPALVSMPLLPLGGGTSGQSGEGGEKESSHFEVNFNECLEVKGRSNE